MEMEQMDLSSSYKDQHERFVSGNDGSSVLEIAMVCSTCPVSILVRHSLLSWMYGKKTVPNGIAFIIDYITIVLPGLFASTLFSSNLDSLLTTLFITALLLFIVREKAQEYANYDHPSNSKSLFDLDMSSHRPFISHFRAYTGIATAVFILAVDFNVFPRRFCKTETYGTGLMDVGVGGFMVANGIVSPEARGKFKAQSGFVAKLKQVGLALKSTIPLWVLGLVRLLTVKGVDYHEHVSEYGVHWNFFFTLAIVKIVSTIILLVFPVSLSWLLSIATILGYQYVLETTNLKEFVLFGTDRAGSRQGILNANREGIFSCFGYLSIYLAAISIGKYLCKPRTKFSDWLRAFAVLFMLNVALWILLHFVQHEVDSVSRRMGNLGFVIWMMAHQLTFLVSFFLVDLVAVTLKHVNILQTPEPGGTSQLCILEAVNRNGLVYFLLANVMTGLVNLSVATIHSSALTAYGVLTVYMLALSVCVAALHVNNVTLKFW